MGQPLQIYYMLGNANPEEENKPTLEYFAIFDEPTTEYTQMMTNRQFVRLFFPTLFQKTLNEMASSKDATVHQFSFYEIYSLHY
jgi:hypothetical protein